MDGQALSARSACLGESCRAVGLDFSVAPSTAGHWDRRYQRPKIAAAQPMGGDRRSKPTQQGGWIAERLAQASELTPGEVRAELAERGIAVSYASVWRAVRRLGCEKGTIFNTRKTAENISQNWVAQPAMSALAKRWMPDPAHNDSTWQGASPTRT